ncbi:MAG: hypothetical protein IKL10_04455 [Clostridia bacterium]|nr:hypothetical protein [Clostridia bacterium]
MENIKNWGLMLLFISAGSLIYCFLLPSGNVSKVAKSIVSVLVLSMVCMPVFGVFSSFESSDFKFSEPPEIKDFSDTLIDSAKKAVENTVHEEVKKYTNVPYKTEIFIDKKEDGSINIEYIGLTFSAKPQREKEMREALFDALSLMPDIKVEYVNE